MHDTIRLLEEENDKLRARLDFAIDIMVLNHDCMLCPMSNDCDYEFSPRDDEEAVIECRKMIKSFFDSIDA